MALAVELVELGGMAYSAVAPGARNVTNPDPPPFAVGVAQNAFVALPALVSLVLTVRFLLVTRRRGW